MRKQLFLHALGQILAMQEFARDCAITIGSGGIDQWWRLAKIVGNQVTRQPLDQERQINGGYVESPKSNVEMNKGGKNFLARPKGLCFISKFYAISLSE